MKIAAVGDNCIDDYIQTGKSYPGGNSVNVSVYIRRLGQQASYVGAVGNDANGRLLTRALEKKGVDISHLQKLPGATAVTEVELVGGERVFRRYDEGVLAQFTLSGEDLRFISSHDLMVTGLWGKTEKYLPILSGGGLPIAFDFANKYDHPIVSQALPHVTYAFFSADGMARGQVEAFLKQIHRQGPKVVVMTLGAEGSLSYDGDQFRRAGIVPCDVKDTMGAGDSYIAGFLTAILGGAGIESAMQAGAECSSVTLGYFGGWEP